MPVCLTSRRALAYTQLARFGLFFCPTLIDQVLDFQSLQLSAGLAPDTWPALHESLQTHFLYNGVRGFNDRGKHHFVPTRSRDVIDTVFIGSWCRVRPDLARHTPLWVQDQRCSDPPSQRVHRLRPSKTAVIGPRGVQIVVTHRVGHLEHRFINVCRGQLLCMATESRWHHTFEQQG